MSPAVGPGEFGWPPIDAFWSQEFPSRTKEATRPAVFKGLLPRDVVTADNVLDGFGRLRQARAAGAAAKARVYVDEDRRDDLVEEVLTAPAWTSTDLFVSWMQELVKAERFSLIVNNLETTSAHLSATFGLFVGSVFSGWGLPIGGAEQVAFIGNYSGTAFGVHKGYEDAFLVHLGPGVKDFYCWSPEGYTALVGSTEPTFGDYRWLLAHGEKFVLEPGDILFLPRRVFHVGVQSEFSISVALPLYTYPKLRLLAYSVLPELIGAILDNESEALDDPSPMNALSAGPAPLADDLAPIARDLLAALAERLEQRTPAIMDAKWQGLLSNGGWEVVDGDLARQDATPQDVGDVVCPGTLVRVRSPYQIRATQDGSLHLRGISVSVPDGALPSVLIDQLNGGHEVAVPDQPSALSAFRALAGTGGLQIGCIP